MKFKRANVHFSPSCIGPGLLLLSGLVLSNPPIQFSQGLDISMRFLLSLGSVQRITKPRQTNSRLNSSEPETAKVVTAFHFTALTFGFCVCFCFDMTQVKGSSTTTSTQLNSKPTQIKPLWICKRKLDL